MPNKHIFKSLKIIDLSSVLAGPSVGSFFAELGADVLKIENPNHPDITRFWKLPNEDKDSSVSAYFSSINYKKNYTELNLKDDSDRNQLLKKIEDVDIIIMNFKLGDQEKLKITDDILRTLNPKLIIGKINGFGTDSDRVAYDLILQAESGIMAMNGTPESGPVKMPIALIDVLAAHHLKEGILIELLARSMDNNYIGRTISVSLYDAAVSSLVNQASNYLMTNHVPQRIGSLHPNIAPYGELFTTSDNKTITFAIGSNTHFEKLCDFIKSPELASNEKFKAVQDRVVNRTELHEILADKLQAYTSEEILTHMHKNHVPCGEVKNLDDVFKTEMAKDKIRTEEINGVKTKRVSGIAFITEESVVLN
ncbi:MAG TPA: CaiB/BaiF CoA-transferase family protein [Brumimicrobium sp.]|nr:CaiB/BaiF CoA-transferase family protein [Brumimicrobium sp.]